VPVTFSPGTYTLEVDAQTRGLCDGSEHGRMEQPTLNQRPLGLFRSVELHGRFLGLGRRRTS